VLSILRSLPITFIEEAINFNSIHFLAFGNPNVLSFGQIISIYSSFKIIEAYEAVSLLIYYYTFQHIQTRLKPLDTEPLTLQTYYSQQIVIRTIDINIITVNQHKTPYTSLYLYSIYNIYKTL
jgi:hypothetical protein